MRLYYLGTKGDGYGWGVCNTNLIEALSKQCDLVVDNGNRKHFESSVFVPIADPSLRPIRKAHSRKKLIGYCFFEYPLTPEARVNAARYDWIFAGSSWCEQKLRDIGINHCSTLVQGVNFERFQPQPWPKREGFVIFSGGKYEYRKAQDIAIAAVAWMQRNHPDVILLTQWYNPFPATAQTMRRSNYVSFEDPIKALDKNRVLFPKAVPNEGMPAVYQQCDVGLFPNRCEGGTNLVLMEMMACARPVIVSAATGHLDVINGPGPLKITQGSYDVAGWFHADVSATLYHLEWLYSHRDQLQPLGDACRKLIEPWTWERAAKTILERVE